MSRADMRRYLIAYDIPDDRRRSSIAKILESFGDRIQYSVFVVDATPVNLEKLKGRLRDRVKLSDDSVLLCDLGLVSRLDRSIFSFMGREREVTDHSSIIA